MTLSLFLLSSLVLSKEMFHFLEKPQTKDNNAVISVSVYTWKGSEYILCSFYRPIKFAFQSVIVEGSLLLHVGHQKWILWGVFFCFGLVFSLFNWSLHKQTRRSELVSFYVMSAFLAL